MSDAIRNDGTTDLVEALAAANMHPVWDRFQTLTPMHPAARDQAMLWAWRDVEPFTARAATEVPVAHVERRALILANPDFGGATITTNSMIAAFTVLEPGDRARPHRHVMSALRFATQAEGAVTIVNGRRCEMEHGDLIITPPMCWHGHVNESDRRTVWFDATNMPLINALDANFFEPGDPGDNAFWSVGEGEDGTGLQAVGTDADPFPKFRYPGAATRRRLAEAPVAADGSRTVRYLNPATGGSVMPTIDCYAMRLARDTPTRPRRTTWNAVCLVVSGTGRSTIGERTLEWKQHDVFTIPHWRFARHEALGGDADLFIVTDREAFERLELLREEFA